MGDSRASALFATLRVGLPHDQGRSLVSLRDLDERRRVAAALAGTGAVEEVPPEELSGLRLEGYDLVVFDHEAAALAGATTETGPELLQVIDADPDRVAAALAAGAFALLPRPLPASDALLRAHLKWLSSSRLARVRAGRGRALLARSAHELEEAAPALKEALAEIEAAADAPITAMALGEVPGSALPGVRWVEIAPDVIVLAVSAADHIEARLREARGTASGAAVVVLDAAPKPDRVAAALYGGARAIVGTGELARLESLVLRVAARRKAELCGRKWAETLARFGVGADPAPKGERSPSGDVDARLISEVAASSAAVVPSGHEVLVVDDEPVVVTVLREALRRGGYQVTTAASAEEAIELLGKRVFDLVLTDKNLPGKSGLDVLRVARGLDPPPAVVLITGYSSYDSALEAFDVGALDYIEKPIKDLENLRQRVRRALSRRDEQLARGDAPGATAGRVLLVEVPGERRQLMAEFLGKTYSVTTVADGDEALARLEAERFDVVLADRNLPGLSGLRVIEQARRLLPHCAAVLYTAYPSYESVKEAFELGVDAFCVRPSEDLKALGDKVAGALRGRGGILLG